MRRSWGALSAPDEEGAGGGEEEVGEGAGDERREPAVLAGDEEDLSDDVVEDEESDGAGEAAHGLGALSGDGHGEAEAGGDDGGEGEGELVPGDGAEPVGGSWWRRGDAVEECEGLAAGERVEEGAWGADVEGEFGEVEGEGVVAGLGLWLAVAGEVESDGLVEAPLTVAEAGGLFGGDEPEGVVLLVKLGEDDVGVGVGGGSGDDGPVASELSEGGADGDGARLFALVGVGGLEVGGVGGAGLSPAFGDERGGGGGGECGEPDGEGAGGEGESGGAHGAELVAASEHHGHEAGGEEDGDGDDVDEIMGLEGEEVEGGVRPGGARGDEVGEVVEDVVHHEEEGEREERAGQRDEEFARDMQEECPGESSGGESHGRVRGLFSVPSWRGPWPVGCG